MKLTIEKRDLFTVSKDYALCHCISGDFALGAGIAKKFAELGVKDALKRVYGRYTGNSGVCLDTYVTDWAGEFNLVTKKRCFEKPTLWSMEQALNDMKRICEAKKIAMPKIGCGLDKLQWSDVEPLIRDIFTDTDVEILVCER